MIDMSGVLPTPERMAQEIRSLLSSEGYRARFGARWSQVMGVPEDVVDRVLAAPSLDARRRTAGGRRDAPRRRWPPSSRPAAWSTR